VYKNQIIFLNSFYYFNLLY